MVRAVVEINGTRVHTAFVALNALWMLIVLLFVPPIFVAWRRLGALYKRSPNRFKTLRVQWAHVVAVWLTLLAVSVDVSHVFFDWSIWINMLALAEVTVLFLNAAVFYFFSHVEAYTISQSILATPDWLPKLRKRWMVANIVVCNSVLIVISVLRRAFVAFLAQQIVGVECVFLSMTLFAITWRLDRTVKLMLNRSPAQRGVIVERMRKFNRFSYLTALILFGMGVGMTVFYYPTNALGPRVRYSEFRQISEPRDDRADFVFSWLSWSSFLLLAYQMRVFWIPRDLLRSRAARTDPHAKNSDSGDKSSKGGLSHVQMPSSSSPSPFLSHHRAPSPFSAASSTAAAPVNSHQKRGSLPSAQLQLVATSASGGNFPHIAFPPLTRGVSLPHIPYPTPNNANPSIHTSTPQRSSTQTALFLSTRPAQSASIPEHPRPRPWPSRLPPPLTTRGGSTGVRSLSGNGSVGGPPVSGDGSVGGRPLSGDGSTTQRVASTNGAISRRSTVPASVNAFVDQGDGSANEWLPSTRALPLPPAFAGADVPTKSSTLLRTSVSAEHVVEVDAIGRCSTSRSTQSESSRGSASPPSASVEPA